MASSQPSNAPSNEVRSYPSSHHIPLSCCKCICKTCKKGISQKFSLPLNNKYLINQIYDDKVNDDEIQPSQQKHTSKNKSKTGNSSSKQKQQNNTQYSFDEEEPLSSTKLPSPRRSINKSKKDDSEYRSYPSERLANISAPNYQSLPTGSSNQQSHTVKSRNYTNERIEDLSPPEFPSFPTNSSRKFHERDGNRSYPSERLTNVSIPLYSSLPQSSLPKSSNSIHEGSHLRQRGVNTYKNPTINSTSGYRTVYRSYPSERIEDISALTYQSIPTASTSKRSYPSEHISGFSPPTHRNLPSGSFIRMGYRTGNIIYPSEHIADISAPTYESIMPSSSLRSNYQSYPDEQIVDISIPLYHSSSPASRIENFSNNSAHYQDMLLESQNQSRYRAKEKSYPYENIVYISASPYQSLPVDSSFRPFHRAVGRRYIDDTNNDIIPHHSTQTQTPYRNYTIERIADVSAPFYHSSNSYPQAQSFYRSGDRSYPNERIDDISALSYLSAPLSLNNRPPRRFENRNNFDERILDISAPVYHSLSQNSPARRINRDENNNYRDERIEDISYPTYQSFSTDKDRSNSKIRSGQYQHLTSRIPIRQPYGAEYEHFAKEIIIDIPEHLYHNSSPASRVQSPYEAIDRSYPTENISNISAPPYQSLPQNQNYSNGKSGEVSGATYQSIPQANISNKNHLNKSIANNSMGFYTAVNRSPCSADNRSYPNERISEISAPLYRSAGNRLSNDTGHRNYLDQRIADNSLREGNYRPEYKSYPASYQSFLISSKNQSGYRVEDKSYPNERIVDISAPAYQSLPPNSPSSRAYRTENKSNSDERIEDISAPTYQSLPPNSPSNRLNSIKTKSYPNERITNISAPAYQSFPPNSSSNRAYSDKNKSHPNERIADISSPAYQSFPPNSSSSKAYRAENKSYPNEIIADISAPTYYSLPPNSTPVNKTEERIYPDERISDISAPSFQSLTTMSQTKTPNRDAYIRYPSRRVQKNSASLYKSLLTKTAYEAKYKSYPSERIADISAPDSQNLSQDFSNKFNNAKPTANGQRKSPVSAYKQNEPEHIRNQRLQRDPSAESLYLTTHPPSSTIKSNHTDEIRENYSFQYYTLPNNTQHIKTSKQISSHTIVSFQYSDSDNLEPNKGLNRSDVKTASKQTRDFISKQPKKPELLAELIIPNNFDRELIIDDDTSNSKTRSKPDSTLASSIGQSPSRNRKNIGSHVVAKIVIPFEFDRQLPIEANQKNSNHSEKATGNKRVKAPKKHPKRKEETIQSTDHQNAQDLELHFNNEPDMPSSVNENRNDQQNQQQEDEPKILFNRKRDMPNNVNIMRKHWPRTQQNVSKELSKRQLEIADEENRSEKNNQSYEQNGLEVVSERQLGMPRSIQNDNISSNFVLDSRQNISDDVPRMRQNDLPDNSDTVFEYLHRMIESIREEFSMNRNFDQSYENHQQNSSDESDHQFQKSNNNLTNKKSSSDERTFDEQQKFSETERQKHDNEREANPQNQNSDVRIYDIYDSKERYHQQRIPEVRQVKNPSVKVQPPQQRKNVSSQTNNDTAAIIMNNSQSLLEDVPEVRSNEDREMLFNNQYGRNEDGNSHIVEDTLYNQMQQISDHTQQHRPLDMQQIFLQDNYSKSKTKDDSCCYDTEVISENCGCRMQQDENSNTCQQYCLRNDKNPELELLRPKEQRERFKQKNEISDLSFSSTSSTDSSIDKEQCCCKEDLQCYGSSKVCQRKRKCKRKAKKRYGN